ncbi:Uncharacterised protein [Klebsiella michiganensis]|nr:Uncharacterised protein [Klebsiella michiganensis]
MKGKYKAAIALLLALVLLPLALLLTLTHWVPTLAGIWLPAGTRISLNESPRLTRSALRIPDLRYLVRRLRNRARRQCLALASQPLAFTYQRAGYKQRLPEQAPGKRSRAGGAENPRRMAINAPLQLADD